MRKKIRQILLTCLTVVAVAAGARPAAAGCSVTKGDFDNNGSTDLKLVGDSAKQNVILELYSGGWHAKIDCNANGTYTDSVDRDVSGTDEIETYILALAGGDIITVHQTGDLVAASKNVVALLAAGANKLTFLSDGFKSSAQTSLGFEVKGGGGADNVTISFAGSTVEDSLVYVRGDLGPSNNTAVVVGAGLLDRSVFDVDLALGLGINNGGYNDGGGVVSNSAVDVRFYGGDVDSTGDTVTTSFSGQIENDSRVYLNTELQKGSDKYFGHFDVSSFGIDAVGAPGSEMWVNANGFTGSDIMKVDDMNVTGSATINGLLSHSLTTGNQSDAVAIKWLGITGTGAFRWFTDGGASSDKINGTVSADPSSLNTLLFHFFGATEFDISALAADTVTVAFDAPGTVSYGPLGAIVLDGGMQGDDTCNFTGTALVSAINCEKGTH